MSPEGSISLCPHPTCLKSVPSLKELVEAGPSAAFLVTFSSPERWSCMIYPLDFARSSSAFPCSCRSPQGCLVCTYLLFSLSQRLGSATVTVFFFSFFISGIEPCDRSMRLHDPSLLSQTAIEECLLARIRQTMNAELSHYCTHESWNTTKLKPNDVGKVEELARKEQGLIESLAPLYELAWGMFVSRILPVYQ